MGRHPGDRYDDLHTRTETERVSPDAYRTLRQTDAGRSGWAVGAVVLDAEDRLLLVDTHWAEGWTVPGGGVEPGESLAGAVVREVREETGVDVEPVRPHAVTETTTVNEESGASFESAFVVFEAAAETTAVGEALGETDEEIARARWFGGLPGDVHERALIECVYRRCVEASR